MKNLIGISAALLLAGMGTGQDRGDVRDRFAGAWRLEQPGADGTLHNVDCTGLFVFTRDGHASVQVMEWNPQASIATGSERYSQGGYEASWGTYKVDERTHTMWKVNEGAPVRALVGKDLPRSYDLSGNQLIVKSTRPDEHWRVAWERY
jgi:hypothetical protein